ncbi:hypothetical protein ACHAXA_004003 [Cyclostephanos tholiformis]|uniref:MgtC/SapB/SrpB/YhiD N-terminal domain-containing protein n=1 Tax=Cyclostephanos tholiformis TaxID=382380 RepID=A0ABD3R921_9STRA
MALAGTQGHDHRQSYLRIIPTLIMPSRKDIVYAILAIYVACTAIAVILEPLATDLPCDGDDGGRSGGVVPPSHPTGDSSSIKFPNVLFSYRPCSYNERYYQLMGLTRRECRFGRHMVASVLLGGAIGYERRSADRPAGMRTMSVVSLASCLFTINSTFVFMIGPMHWDPARVSAAVPSGVGFLGAGLMVQDVLRDDNTGHTTRTIRGIATAASVWLSAAVGIACGGGLYFAATFTSALLMALLRFGPRSAITSRATSMIDVVDDVSRDGSSALPMISSETERRWERDIVKFRSGARSQSLNFH